MVGQVCGRLTVIARDKNMPSGQARWVCRCSCGNLTAAQGADLRGGKTKSCGCLRDQVTAERFTTHGHSTGRAFSPEYSTYNNMVARCSPIASEKNRLVYAARGIVVCDRWLSGDGAASGFECFLADMGPKPGRGFSIERKNNDKGYSPDNCRWATAIEQANNKKNNIKVFYRGQEMTFRDAWRLSSRSVGWATAWHRLKNGWHIDEALDTPPVPIRGRRKKGSHHVI